MELFIYLFHLDFYFSGLLYLSWGQNPNGNNYWAVLAQHKRWLNSDPNQFWEGSFSVCMLTVLSDSAYRATVYDLPLYQQSAETTSLGRDGISPVLQIWVWFSMFLEHCGPTCFQKSSQWSWMSHLRHRTSRGERQEFPKNQTPYPAYVSNWAPKTNGCLEGGYCFLNTPKYLWALWRGNDLSTRKLQAI